MPFTPEERRQRARARRARYRAANREKVNAEQRAYAAQHREEIRAKAKTPEGRTYFREYARNRRQNDPEPQRLASQRYRERHPEKAKATNRVSSSKRYYANREERLLQEKIKRANMTEEDRIKERARVARYREANRAVLQERSKAWMRDHPEVNATRVQRRRARMNNIPTNDLTAEQYQLVLEAAHGLCAYCYYYKTDCTTCKRHAHKLTIDHITAVWNAGPNTLHNLVACCRSCNAKKGTRPPPGPVQPLLL